MPLNRQLYGELPDGFLSDRDQALDAWHGAVIQRLEPDAIYTSGPDGYDGHPDHIAVHESILRVCQHLSASAITLNALDSSHEGSLVVSATLHKLGAMAYHATQRVTDDLERWGDTDLYKPLIIEAETYTPVLF